MAHYDFTHMLYEDNYRGDYLDDELPCLLCRKPIKRDPASATYVLVYVYVDGSLYLLDSISEVYAIGSDTDYVFEHPVCPECLEKHANILAPFVR